MTGLVNYREPPVPAFLFDLDGTLIDSVKIMVLSGICDHSLARAHGRSDDLAGTWTAGADHAESLIAY